MLNIESNSLPQKIIKKIVLLFVVGFLHPVFAQDVLIEGVVTDKFKKGLEYVNIGIRNRDIGTVSDTAGNFQILIGKSHLDDSITFSYVGYRDFSIRVRDILHNRTEKFELVEDEFLLREVVLTSSKPKEKKIGRRSYFPGVEGLLWDVQDKNKDIRELAKEIEIKKPSKILNLHVNLLTMSTDSVRFRINFYSVKDNLPFEKIGSENIFIVKKLKNGWNEFDLRSYDLHFVEPFFVSLEYIPDERIDNEPFRYRGQFTGKTISRRASLGSWNVIDGISVSFYVTVHQ